MSDPFKIDTNDVLGINYSAYKTKVYALALSKPSDYYKIREQVVAAIKNAAVKNIYEIIYGFLKDGVAGPGVSLESSNMIGAKPCYPSSKINEIALGAAESLDSIIEDTIKICLPANYDDIAQKKLTQKGESLGIDK
jgi:hypothetical protein